MTEDPRELHKATVEAVYRAFARGDVAAALKYLAPDVELRPEGTSRLTGRAVYRGHDGIRDYFDDVRRVWPEGLELIPLDYRAVAGSVVVFGQVRGAQGDELVEVEVVWVWKVRNGLLASGQVFSTRAAALAAAATSRG